LRKSIDTSVKTVGAPKLFKWGRLALMHHLIKPVTVHCQMLWP